ncbi:MAG: hypothetical protein LQ342_006496 [Letrouitia transgressa]|nr:MAG: hypothetical protein LQ342_006496 [Letrouitia transgressa]
MPQSHPLSSFQPTFLLRTLLVFLTATNAQLQGFPATSGFCSNSPAGAYFCFGADNICCPYPNVCITDPASPGNYLCLSGDVNAQSGPLTTLPPNGAISSPSAVSIGPIEIPTPSAPVVVVPPSGVEGPTPSPLPPVPSISSVLLPSTTSLPSFTASVSSVGAGSAVPSGGIPNSGVASSGSGSAGDGSVPHGNGTVPFTGGAASGPVMGLDYCGRVWGIVVTAALVAGAGVIAVG